MVLVQDLIDLSVAVNLISNLDQTPALGAEVNLIQDRLRQKLEQKVSHLEAFRNLLQGVTTQALPEEELQQVSHLVRIEVLVAEVTQTVNLLVKAKVRRVRVTPPINRLQKA